MIASRALRTGALITALLAVTGMLAGLLWAAVAPEVRFVAVDGRALPAAAESEAMIAVDGWFALITFLAGSITGVIAHLAARRADGVMMVLALAFGGTLAAVLAWQTGHVLGLAEFERRLAGAADGTVLTGPAQLRSLGTLSFWPLLAVGGYAMIQAALHRIETRDATDAGAGEPDEVGGGELDLQAAPPGRDIDRRKI